MKKFLNLFFSFAVLASLFAVSSCGKPDDPTPTPTPPEEEKTADFTALSLAISDITELLALESDPYSGYTAEAFAALKAAKSAAETVANNKKATQEQVDAATKAAKEAIEAFKSSYKFVSVPCELYIPGAISPSYIELGEPGDFDDLADKTVELWFKGDDVMHYQRQGIIIGNFDGRPPFAGWALNTWSTTTEVQDGEAGQKPFPGPYLIRASQAYTEGRLREPSTAFNDYTKWNHIAYTYDAKKDKHIIYMNGEVIKEETVNLPYQNRTDKSQVYMFQNPGSRPGESNPMSISARVKNVRIWSKVLDQDQIKSYMNKDVTGKEDGLMAAWDFTSTVENPAEILDKTGRYNAGVYGADVQWIKTK